MDILIWPNNDLNIQTQPVTDFGQKMSNLVENMFTTLYANNGLGLAANQVGVLKQVVVIDTTSSGGTLNQEFINPRITMSDGRQMYKEGCLSFPGVYINMTRYETVGVEAQDKTGKTFSVIANGVDAVCLQHELDHLSGITFYDKLSPVKKSMYSNKFKKLKKRKK